MKTLRRKEGHPAFACSQFYIDAIPPLLALQCPQENVGSPIDFIISANFRNCPSFGRQPLAVEIEWSQPARAEPVLFEIPWVAEQKKINPDFSE